MAASIAYRRRTGKPIFPRAPAGAVFAEAWCSGRSLKNGLTRVGGASNCLLVYVADGALTVIPVFPFNLMFLPEIYGLEATVPTAELTARPTSGLFGNRLLLTPGKGRDAPIELAVRDRQGLINALDGNRDNPRPSPQMARPAPHRRRWAGWFSRLFTALWGVLALSFAGYGLWEDILFRVHGATATAHFVEPAGASEPRRSAGILSYAVDGRVYSFTFLEGPGLYRIGQPKTVRYLPADPSDAREDDNLGLDLVFGGLGLVMLTISITFGGISRAFNRYMGVA